jgi:hypothetical protein
MFEFFLVFSFAESLRKINSFSLSEVLSNLVKRSFLFILSSYKLAFDLLYQIYCFKGSDSLKSDVRQILRFA